jgi:hypothetical protein
MKTPRMLRGVGLFPVVLERSISSSRTRQRTRFSRPAVSVIGIKDKRIHYFLEHIVFNYTIIVLTGQLCFLSGFFQRTTQINLIFFDRRCSVPALPMHYAPGMLAGDAA